MVKLRVIIIQDGNKMLLNFRRVFSLQVANESDYFKVSQRSHDVYVNIATHFRPIELRKAVVDPFL